MKTILTALRDEEKVVDEDARTIARALGGTTVSTAISPTEDESEGSDDSDGE